MIRGSMFWLLHSMLAPLYPRDLGPVDIQKRPDSISRCTLPSSPTSLHLRLQVRVDRFLDTPLAPSLLVQPVPLNA